MLLQTFSSSSLLQHTSLSSSSSHSKLSTSLHNSSIVLLPKRGKKSTSSITCYIPQTNKTITTNNSNKQNYRPASKWNLIYKRVSLMENPDAGAGVILNLLEKEHKKGFSRWELCRVVKELRKYRKFKLALEVYEWMNGQGKKFNLTSSDAAIQLDLISKVHGIPSTEEYFSQLPETLKDKRTYGSLLNAYVRSKMREKAESLIEEMNSKGYGTHALPYNVMMTLYMKLKEYDKAISMVSEMLEKNVQLDIYSYNIWLTACGAMKSAEKMEEVLERLKADSAVDPNWTTYSTMATIYINLGELKKAKDSLSLFGSKLTGRERTPYHYLLSLYGSIGEKEEVYRVWDSYKSSFPNIPNLGYHSMIASLVRLDDIAGAERIYNEWVPVRTSYDPRVCNLLIGWYVQNGLLDKAEDFLDRVLETGGKVNAHSWELLADGHITKQHIPEVLSCFKKATLAEGGETWRPNPTIVSRFLSLCEQESDIASKEACLELLTQAGCLEDKVYRAMISSNGNPIIGHNTSSDKDGIASDNDNENDSGPDMLLSQLEGSL